jgi:hypothetical protein
MAARGADIGEEIDHRADADDGDQHRPGQRKGVDAGLPALAAAPELVCGQASEGEHCVREKEPGTGAPGGEQSLAPVERRTQQQEHVGDDRGGQKQEHAGDQARLTLAIHVVRSSSCERTRRV